MGIVIIIILQETAVIVLFVSVVHFKENRHDRRFSTVC